LIDRIKGRREGITEHPLQFVFVVTYGRSGSTLLQGLLNTLPRVLVRGENGLYVLPIYRACAQAMAFRERHKRHRPGQVTSAFYGLRSVRRPRFVRATRTLVTETLLGPVPRDQLDVIGFKEVRWDEIRPEETEGFFGFMDSAFPGARYILNQRAHDRVAASGFWQDHDTDQVFAALERVEDIQAYLRRSRPGRILDTTYEQITSADEAVSRAELRAIAEFVVGSCDDILLDTLQETLRGAYGPHAFGASHGRRERRERRARRAARARDRS